ncbi:MAG: GNAT family N-acetyltransferase [Bacteroidetes bacterium]|nr:GNAT family N-acetyltransferase [Bacteroidota bacterium]
MINYLKHTQIDINRWNDCISKSINRRVYAFSWYLDIVSPGWDALVEGDYERVFPLTHKNKWGICYLAQPYFTQQLGVFSPTVISQRQVADFISAIPLGFRYVEIHLNSMNNFAGPEETPVQRVNYELDLSPSGENLTQQYSQNTRRNIRKARESGVLISHSTGVDELIDLFRYNFGEKEGKLKESNYATLRRLITHGLDHNLGFILGSTTKEGILSAGAFFLFDHARVYFLFAASGAEARENGGMFFLIDQFIDDNSGKNLILDFEGGNDANLGRFYKSFGAIETLYPTLHLNRLSKGAERGLYFIRRFRK